MIFATLKLVNKELAATHMAGHNAWIQRGLENGFIGAVGSLVGTAGGAIVSNSQDEERFTEFLAEDPFVEHGVVEVELTQVEIKKTIPELESLAQ